MVHGMTGRPGVRRAHLALVVGLVAVAFGLAAGASAAGTKRIRCVPQDPCVGTNKPNRLIGTPGSDEIRGLAGSDSLAGKSGNDELNGGRGIDGVYGGRGSDVLRVGPNQEETIPYDYREFLQGGPGHDVMYGNGGLNIFAGGDGNDTMYGGAGRDDYWYETKPWGHDVIVDFRDPGHDNMLWLSNSHNDLVINLDSSSDHHEMRVVGGYAVGGTATVDWADDAINFVLGGGGDDVMVGNEHDNIFVVQGNDTVYGGEGADSISAQDWDANAIVYGDGGDDVINVIDALDGRDGGPDTVDCGPGDADEVHFDANDTVTNCEILNPEPDAQNP